MSCLELTNATFFFPEDDLPYEVFSTTTLGEDPLAGSAPRFFIDGIIVDLHAACLAHLQALAALGSELSPLPAVASVTDAVIEAHYERAWSLLTRPIHRLNNDAIETIRCFVERLVPDLK
jgi:hypothetical protein